MGIIGGAGRLTGLFTEDYPGARIILAECEEFVAARDHTLGSVCGSNQGAADIQFYREAVVTTDNVGLLNTAFEFSAMEGEPDFTDILYDTEKGTFLQTAIEIERVSMSAEVAGDKGQDVAGGRGRVSVNIVLEVVDLNEEYAERQGVGIELLDMGSQGLLDITAVGELGQYVQVGKFEKLTPVLLEGVWSIDCGEYLMVTEKLASGRDNRIGAGGDLNPTAAFMLEKGSARRV